MSPVPELTRFQRRQILTACITYFAFHTLMSGIPVGSMGYFLRQKLPDGLTIAGVAIGIATLNGVIISTRWATAVAAPYFGYLGDRHGREGVVLVAIPICLVSLMLLTFPASLLATVLFLPLAFAATGASITALDATVGALASANRRATVMSMYATWQDVGSAIGPLVAYAALGFTSSMLVYIGGAVLMGLVFFPKLSGMLRWPGIALLITGAFFFVAGKIAESEVPDRLTYIIETGADRVSEAPPSVTDLGGDILISFGSQLTDGFVGPSITLLVIGAVLVGSSFFTIIIGRFVPFVK